MAATISIITVCLNNHDTIEDTILAVSEQDYPNIEYIVLDGQSTDGTLDVIEKHKNEISVFKSEKDEGLYFALNNGIALATGDYIAFLHADDFYSHKNVISVAMKKLQETNADALYGDLLYVSKKKKNKVRRWWDAKEYKEGAFLYGWMPPHPTFIVKKEIYEKYGDFNTDFKSAADYELMLRFIHKNKISLTYLHLPIVLMRMGGKSNRTVKNRLFANKEDKKAWEVNGLQPKWYTTILKPLRKIFQWRL